MSYVYLKQLCILLLLGGVFYKRQVKLVDRVKSYIACFSCYFFKHFISPPILPVIPFLSVILVCVFALVFLVISIVMSSSLLIFYSVMSCLTQPVYFSS